MKRIFITSTILILFAIPFISLICGTLIFNSYEWIIPILFSLAALMAIVKADISGSKLFKA